MNPLAFSTGDAARMLGISAKTLANWRCLGKGPAYIRLGNSSRAQILYRYDDLDAWLCSLDGRK
ncbi:helix-turn-helix domain-containing protein [uncultured Collinsella sp.]|uniref:helix-turn-helix transcriptional regulator n=1 Tax=uncultured Collinsella sp. TaxID=165190 RepID=UPI00344D2431